MALLIWRPPNVIFVERQSHQVVRTVERYVRRALRHVHEFEMECLTLQRWVR